MSRTLLATAEGHQEYIDNMYSAPWWHYWVYGAIGGVDLVGGSLSLLLYWVLWFPLALPLGLVLLAVGTVVLAYPWMHRPRGPVHHQSKKTQNA